MMSGSAAVAEDVTQEVFMALLRDLSRYEPQRAGLPTYLYGVARNVTRGLLRRERRFVRMDVVGREAPEPAIADDPSCALQATETLGRLRRAILALPSRYREVVILCDVHGLTYADAAAALRLPVGTVRSRLHRGRQFLGERLRTAGEESAAGSAIKRCLA